MGATTITYDTPLRRVSRHLVERSGTVTFSGTYATGGDTFAPVSGKTPRVFIAPSGGFLFEYVSTGLLKVYRDGATAGSTPLDQVSNGASLTAVTTTWQSIGKK